MNEPSTTPRLLTKLGTGVLVVDGMLSAAERSHLLERALAQGLRPARLASHGRRNTEAFVIDAQIANRVAARLRAVVALIEIDDLFEIYRYQPGQRLDVHEDMGRHIRNGHTSNATMVTYLSEGFTGGRTTFPAEGLEVNPGLAGSVIFAHGVPHSAEEVLAGTKYVARSDLVLQR